LAIIQTSSYLPLFDGEAERSAQHRDRGRTIEQKTARRLSATIYESPVVRFFCEPMTQLIDSSFISSNDQSMTSRVATATNRNVVTKTSRVSMQSLCHSSRILDAMAHETNKQRKVTNQKIFQLWNISMFPSVNFAARAVTLTDHRLYGFVCWKI
jgi:hypothetical protein